MHVVKYGLAFTQAERDPTGFLRGSHLLTALKEEEGGEVPSRLLVSARDPLPEVTGCDTFLKEASPSRGHKGEFRAALPLPSPALGSAISVQGKVH